MTEPCCTWPTTGHADLQQLGINIIRGLAMDRPGGQFRPHGTAMALAPLAHVLFTRIMRHDPTEPDWPDRDRFVLSNGHASILLYSMLYLTGYGLTLDDSALPAVGKPDTGPPRARSHPGRRSHHRARSGRGWPTAWAWGSPSAGSGPTTHPRSATTTSTSSPATGASRRGSPTRPPPWPGTSGSGRLVYVYDNNHITIDGPTELAYKDNVAERFAAYGWASTTSVRWPTTSMPSRRPSAGPRPTRTGPR